METKPVESRNGNRFGMVTTAAETAPVKLSSASATIHLRAPNFLPAKNRFRPIWTPRKSSLGEWTSLLVQIRQNRENVSGLRAIQLERTDRTAIRRIRNDCSCRIN